MEHDNNENQALMPLCVFLVATRQIGIATHHVEGNAGHYYTGTKNASHFPCRTHLHEKLMVSNISYIFLN